MNNPLLETTGLPRFSQIQPEHVIPAIDQVLAANRAQVAELLAQLNPPTWDTLIIPIERLNNRLDRAWSPVSHLNAMCNTPEWREAYNACLPKLSDYATEMGQNAQLYQAYKTVAANGASYDRAQRKLLDNALRDFHLSGVDLPPAQQARFKAISQRLSQLASDFDAHLLDATHAWSKLITELPALAGLPNSALDLFTQMARQREQAGWLLTLEYPAYLPVITYADDRALRQEIYTAYVTRASDQGPHAGQWDNGPLIEEILALRHELAKLLGFTDYAACSLATKMADSPTLVLEFLHDLARRSKPQAQREWAELQEFARIEHGVSDLQAWDVLYYTEKLRQQRYAISQETLRSYFPAPSVIQGLFKVVAQLFGMDIQLVVGIEVWHPTVTVYAIYDQSGELRGHFYLDPYARPKKRGGAWMDGCLDRMQYGHVLQLPAAYLVCNFAPPVADRPSLLTHEEVSTLFHELGHGLHHLLTRINYPAVAGINGVAWDAVELPSQLLENWCWEQPVLNLFARHWETGAELPETLYQCLYRAKHFQSAMQMVRQLELALFDFRLHSEYDPAYGARVAEILIQVREQVAVLQPPAFNRFSHGFAHIFSGGYASGYYSYKWAEVLSADAFSLFEERGLFDAASGQAFLEQILEMGGAADANELYRAFRGREPSIEPLLRHSGIYV